MRILPFAVLGPVLGACELVSGLGALHEIAGDGESIGEDASSGAEGSPALDGGSGGDGSGGGSDSASGVDDGALEDGVIPDVRALSDVVVPSGSYLLHVGIYRAHVTSDIDAIACGGLQPDGAPSKCDAVLLAGTQLVLTAVGSGSFDGWAGACAAAPTTTCQLVMTSDQYVFASFSLNH
jgi:hypothetical protein